MPLRPIPVKRSSQKPREDRRKDREKVFASSLPKIDRNRILCNFNPNCSVTMGAEEQLESQSPPNPPVAHILRPAAERVPSLSVPSDVVHVDDDITYPEGGREAWLVVVGAWCGLASSIGLYNSTGVFEAYISREILTDESPSTVGWIFGIYAFMTFFLGAQVGPTFDAKGPRGLLMAEYYQFILAFSILTGTGSSLLVTPAMSSVAHWFSERRGMASGIAWTGAAIGGVIFPLVLQDLLPRIGWAWSVRVLGFMLLVLCLASVALCRSRVPPRNGKDTTWKDTLPSARIFFDGTGAFSLTTAAMFLVDLAYLVPMTYLPSFYLERQDLPPDAMLREEGAFAFQLVAIVNAASVFGRYVAGDIGDRFGRYNTLIVSLFLCVASVSCFWLPDVLITSLSSPGLLITFSILFGFVSGSNVSLTPICLGQLCGVQEYGRYYSTCYTVASIGCLISIPIAGGLLGATELHGRERWWATVAYTGIAYVGALCCLVWVRVRVKGWNWRTKWIK
ncbi:putative transporter MCH4 [Paramyrothecium foliicola]|nr:putative transporter MCH4 [Paramyrothecium foliicola]